MSRKRKAPVAQTPVAPAQENEVKNELVFGTSSFPEDKTSDEIKESIRTSVEAFESPLVDKKVYSEFMETEISKVEKLEKLENTISEVLEGRDLSLPVTSEEGLKMFNEALMKEATKQTEKLAEAVPASVNIRSHYSTLLEFFQARACNKEKELNFIPTDYISIYEGTNIINSIDFTFMTPFATIKGNVDYCTVDESEVYVEEGLQVIPTRYNLIKHEMTTEVKFCKIGEYDVKSIFDVNFSNLVSSLFNNHKIEK